MGANVASDEACASKLRKRWRNCEISMEDGDRPERAS